MILLLYSKVSGKAIFVALAAMKLIFIVVLQNGQCGLG